MKRASTLIELMIVVAIISIIAAIAIPNLMAKSDTKAYEQRIALMGKRVVINNMTFVVINVYEGDRLNTVRDIEMMATDGSGKKLMLDWTLAEICLEKPKVELEPEHK